MRVCLQNLISGVEPRLPDMPGPLYVLSLFTYTRWTLERFTMTELSTQSPVWQVHDALATGGSTYLRSAQPWRTH